MFVSLENVADAIDKLAASEGPIDLTELRRQAERLESEWLRRVREQDRAKKWAADDFISPAAWLRSETNLSPGDARQTVTLARKLDDFPVFAAAFAEGDTSRAHARVLTNAATPERLPALQEFEPDLVEAARHIDPKQFRQLLDHLCGALDGDDGAAEANEQYEQRKLHVSRTFNGMVKLDGVFTPDDGETIITALKSEMRRDHTKGDGRTLGQARADALVNILSGEHPARPDVLVAVDLKELDERAPGISTEIRADLVHGGKLSRATLQRLTCDANISRVITDGSSRVLDLGRSTPVVSSAQHRALAVRDGHCQAPGCDRPAGWCQGHHIWHWTKGGPTDLDNLILLCPRHHRDYHEGGKSPPPEWSDRLVASEHPSVEPGDHETRRCRQRS
jgi:hypothetical protein